MQLLDETRMRAHFELGRQMSGTRAPPIVLPLASFASETTMAPLVPLRRFASDLKPSLSSSWAQKTCPSGRRVQLAVSQAPQATRIDQKLLASCPEVGSISSGLVFLTIVPRTGQWGTSSISHLLLDSFSCSAFISKRSYQAAQLTAYSL